MNQWQSLNDKFDALSQREKVMTLSAGLVVIFLIGFTFFVEPIFKENNTLSKDVDNLQVAVNSLKLQQQTFEQALAIDPDKQYKDQLKQLQQRMESVDKDFADEIGQLVPPSAMPSLITSIMNASNDLVLENLIALPPVNVFADNPTMDDIKLYQHGVKMQFNCTFADAQLFLQNLEDIDWQVYWRIMRFDVNAYPISTLTIEFYTLSTEEVFIRV